MSDLTKRAVLSDSRFNQRTAALNLINGISPIKSSVRRQLVNDDSWSPVSSPARSPARRRNLRKAEISGISKCRDLSFEHNQSFPLMKPHHREDFLGFISPCMTMEKIRGDSLNSCRFSAGRRRCSFSSMKPLPDALSGTVDHLLPSEASTASATLCASVSNSQPPAFHKTVMLNPNKAVFTFDFKTMKILVVNQMACRLLGFSPDELCGLTLVQLLNRQHAHTPYALSEEHLDTTHGTTLGVSGKVVEMVSKDGGIIPVSLWLRRLQMDDRCLAVAEPVERRVAKLEVDSFGRILWMDQDATQLFQYTIEEVEGEDIKLLIPAFLMPTHPDCLPKEVRKQKATGRTKYGTSFPLCLRLSEELDEGSGDSSVAAVTYSIILWVFSNMSGLLVLTPDGNVEQCNHHFTHIMFGFTQAQLSGKHITTVIPNFTHDPVCNGDDSVLPPFQLGEELAENALNTDSTTPQAWRSNNDTDSQSTNRMDTESHSTNILSLDNSNHTDCRRLIESVSQLSDLTNKITLRDDETTSAGLTLQNDISSAKNYKMFSCASDTLSNGQKENSPPDEGSDPLVTADNTTCEEFSQSEDDTLNGNKNKNNKLLKLHSKNSHSPTVSVELSSCVGVTSSSMCTCTSHPSRYSHEMDDNTLSASSVSHVKPPAPSPVTLPDTQGSFPEGHFIGFGKHRDGSNIEIVYQVRLVQLRCGRQLYCVWISRDCEEEDPVYGNLTFTSSLESSAIEPSLGQEIQARAHSASRPSSLSIMTQCEDELLMGEYGERYSTLQQIGKGAYGFVKMAYRNEDNILVITKFIHKKKVHEQSWVEDPILGKRVPLEVSLLTTIKHPNIVRVLDVFENETFYQMVMEKHGAGMDLFEFVDRRPKLDEPLISFIFRQIVAAVQYLHSLKILHRDIKDENVIIDQKFHAKLIDFGSATFMSADRLFSTFYGTVEYCSPEVLAGNKYEGPELEVWSLGVTLYVLTFGENPFFDVEETLKAELRPPGTASPQLLGLLHAMLERDPSMRLNMNQLCAHPWINQLVDPNQYHFQEVVNCMPHEYDPPTFYADYQQSRPISRSRDYLMPPAHSGCGDDDDDRTDLATSNSLTSLTPVDETAGQSFPPCSSGFVELKKHQLLNDDLNEAPTSSTPLKPKTSASPIFSVLQTTENNCSDPSEVHTKSSSSISLVRSSSSSSLERSASSMTVSMNHKENDSLAQHLLDGNSLEGNFSCAGLLTDEEDYLNDDFEDERESECGEIRIGNAGDERDTDANDSDASDDDNDVNCATCCRKESHTLEEENKL
ncbi:PAS domain-containing serine/threonine-protein kinase isoform X1 [Frankliniella occidentalis]|uniref:PAS domain-containing serine/threonine-protein kinase isoform X1 n=2 Tax=Frankliniella occidentalis TaxID=133901 RepID=A0A6J1S3B5_FRAOC|nr:PAS domain-containing serine/threonine-protein kinase isoform X1 [Frankliniella occidentalis]